MLKEKQQATTYFLIFLEMFTTRLNLINNQNLIFCMATKKVIKKKFITEYKTDKVIPLVKLLLGGLITSLILVSAMISFLVFSESISFTVLLMVVLVIIIPLIFFIVFLLNATMNSDRRKRIEKLKKRIQ